MSATVLPTIDIVELLRRRAQQTDDALRCYLAAVTDMPATLAEAMRYSLDAGGKRLRSALVFECCAACGGHDDDALPAAAAIECVHTFSLIHDDLPAMDDDDLRRGRPTNHKVFGEALAILAGDALLTFAFELLAREMCRAEAARDCILCLARAVGAAGMIGGQALDIEGETQPVTLDRVRHVHELKTARLIAAACELGAIAGSATADQRDALRRYGVETGRAFQAVDDWLDATASAANLGKMAGKDGPAGKQSMPAAIGLDETRRTAADHIDRAIAALSPFGSRSASVAALAQFVLERES